MENPSSRVIFQKSVQNVEKWSDCLNFALLNVTALLTMWPTFIYSYFIYFSTDMQEEAFILPFYIW